MNYTPEQKANWDRVIKMIMDDLLETGQEAIYNVWFRPLRLYGVTEDALYISGDTDFNLRQVKTRYGTVIYSIVRLMFGRTYELEFYPEKDIAEVFSRAQESTLNRRYTFENFVVGPSNNFAFAASLAVAQTPTGAYNPLFIYGGVGLGKTHLMNAIGNHILSENKNAIVRLMTSEAMTNQLIESIANKTTPQLRSQLRRVDVLMVDDIQFLSRTKATQTEFFNTFNELHAANKQIIIASDRPPNELPEIEERLRSRFGWGVIVDIQKPDYETRVAILKQKMRQMTLEVPQDVVEYIAANVNSNIRELEGCLNSLEAHSKLMNVPVTLEMARELLAGRIGAQTKRSVTPELIIEVIAGQYHVSPDDLIGQKRSRDIALPRQVAMYVCRELTSLSTTSIGRAFGGRDHTTVMHNCDRIAEAMKADFAFKKRVEELIGLVKGQ